MRHDKRGSWIFRINATPVVIEQRGTSLVSKLNLLG